MARTKAVKIVFNFLNRPEKLVEPPFSDHSLAVVNAFVSRLDPSSSARVASLEVSKEHIRFHRRKRTPAVGEKFTVALDLQNMTATEAMLVKALCETGPDNLRRIVDTAAGLVGYDAKFAGRMIASSVFLQYLSKP